MEPLPIKMKNTKTQKGFSVVEVMLAVAIFAIFSIGVFYLSLDTIQRDIKVNLGTEALLYAQEGIESVRNIRDKNYLYLTNGDKGLSLVAGSWEFIAAPEDIEGFYSRTIIIEDVYRNESGDIDEDGLNYDPDTKKITSEVNWMQRGVIPKSISLTTYMSNWTGDDWLEDTCTDFNMGTFDNIEAKPGVSPPADNCNLALTFYEINSDIFESVDFGHHGVDVVLDGNYAYLATGSSAEGLAIVDVSDPENLTTADIVDFGNKGNRIIKHGNYAYIGSQDSKLGLSVVDVSNPNNAFEYFSWDIEGIGNQPSILGDYLYMGVDDNSEGLQVYDVSSGQLPTQLRVDEYDFGSSVYYAIANGNYLYLGMDDDTLGFRIMDISDPANISEVSSLNVGEEVNAIVLSGSIAFLGTEDTTDSLKVVDISNPGTPSLITSVDVGGAIMDLARADEYLYAAVDNQNAGLASLNVSNPFLPYLVYSLDIQGKGLGIDATPDYVYVATTTSNKGLVMMGTTETATAETGTFLSQVFDTGSTETRYNFIEWDQIDFPSGDIRFQIKTANSALNLETATWIGSDGTNATYYDNPRTVITLDPSRSGVRYFQYKALIDSDGINSPVIESVRINFTP